MTNTPASEREWPKDALALADALSAHLRTGEGPRDKLDIKRCEHCLGLIKTALRTAAGVDDKHAAENAAALKLADNYLFNEDADELEDQEVIDICWALYRSRHTAVTAAGVDTVGHTAVPETLRMDTCPPRRRDDAGIGGERQSLPSVGHDDVTVEELELVVKKWFRSGAIARAETSLAQALFDDFNVTRKTQI